MTGRELGAVAGMLAQSRDPQLSWLGVMLLARLAELGITRPDRPRLRRHLQTMAGASLAVDCRDGRLLVDIPTAAAKLGTDPDFVTALFCRTGVARPMVNVPADCRVRLQ